MPTSVTKAKKKKKEKGEIEANDFIVEIKWQKPMNRLCNEKEGEEEKKEEEEGEGEKEVEIKETGKEIWK